MNDAVLCVADILCHAAVCVGHIAKHIVGLTHPITTGFTEFAFSARNNLICCKAFANFITFNILTKLSNAPKELMSRNERRFYPRRHNTFAPVTSGLVIALNV